MQPGPQQLKDWMARRGYQQRETAECLGMHEGFISQLVNGKRIPGLAYAIKIQRLTGIPAESWVLGQNDKMADDDAADVA